MSESRGIVQAPPAPARARPKGARNPLLSVLDHLEEWLITVLIAAATLIIFVAVVHRYGTGVAIDSLGREIVLSEPAYIDLPLEAVAEATSCSRTVSR